jgi:MFS family permease
MRTEGYSTELAASMVSLFGLVLVCSKLLTGAVADRIGSKRCSILLFSIFILGCFLVLGMDGQSLFWCAALAVLLGLGASLFNVGPPLWAADLSSKDHYPKTLKHLQMLHICRRLRLQRSSVALPHAKTSSRPLFCTS